MTAPEPEYTIYHHLATVDGSVSYEFVVVHEHAIVAQCRVEDWNLPGGWINWVHVVEANRRQGWATILLGHVLETAQTAGKEGLSLTVQAANEGAQQLYRALGFRSCGVPYYDLARIVMTRHLVPVPELPEAQINLSLT